MILLIDLLFDSAFCSRLGLVLLHSLWQVAALVVVAWGVERFWLKRSVERGYGIYVAALLAALVAMLVTFGVLGGGGERLAFPTAEAVSPVDAPASKVYVAPSVPFETQANVPVAVPSTLNLPVVPAVPVENVAPTVWQRAAPWLVVGYGLGVVLMLVRLVRAWVSSNRLGSRAEKVVDGPLVETLRSLARQWSLRVVPVLAETQEVVIPKVVGLARPMILLPTAAIAGLSPSELEMILAHELAHVRRHDMWVNLLQRLAEVALFFNPALWLLSRRISTLREYCCDEMTCEAMASVESKTGSKNDTEPQLRYATALLHVAELAQPKTVAHSDLAALAASGRSPSELRRRVARLFGEPLREPVRVTRTGFLMIGFVLLLMVYGPMIWPSQAETKDASETKQAFPPPMTDADRIVAAARARTFGLQKFPKLKLKHSYWNAPVLSMQNEQEKSLENLWKSRTEKSDRVKRVEMAITLAWDQAKLLIRTDFQNRSDGSLYTDYRYWDGSEGLHGNISEESRGIARYASLDDLMNHFQGMDLPYLIASGNRLPWPGSDAFIDHEIAPALTRYQKVGYEVIDGMPCDIYDGAARSERLWIGQSTGLVKAHCRSFAHHVLPNYYTELVKEVAGRTFADVGEYRTWSKQQNPQLLAKLSALWAVVHWPSAKPGSLHVFSNYRQLGDGVQLPMRCERLIVHPNGRNKAGGFNYTYAETAIDEVTEEFDLNVLTEEILPKRGDTIWDRRFGTAIEYDWKPNVDVQEYLDKKLYEKRLVDEENARVNNTPIHSVDDAIKILTEGPKTDPTKVWARAIKYLVSLKEVALPALIKQLDSEKRDHPISKLAFALRAIGDPRAVPALIRALPNTLQPSRSDYGLLLEDAELCTFMQRHSLSGKVQAGSNTFGYGRAFREVTGALHRLTSQNFGEMDLNWVHLAETESQQAQQRKIFHTSAQRWAGWWETNWDSVIEDSSYSKVNLSKLDQPRIALVGRRQPPAGPGVKLAEGHGGWIVPSVHESTGKCFVDLDTGREVGWPKSLPPVEKTGLDSPELLAWAREEGFDMVGVSHTPKGENSPLFCLRPIDMSTWQITAEEHRDLKHAMAGGKPYPLSRPVSLMVPQREVKRPYDYKYGGVAFLFVTREGTAGLIRMTGQVTEAKDMSYQTSGPDDNFSSIGFYRGAKISFAAMMEPQKGNPTLGEATGKELPKNSMTLRVLDVSGKPIADAKVFQNHILETPNGKRPTTIKNHDYFTDSKGDAVITWKGSSKDLRIWISKPGFVPLHAMWAKDFQMDGDKLPTVFPVMLEVGTEIGGIVTDEHGEPIEGVKVEIMDVTALTPMPARAVNTGRRPVRVTWLAEEETALHTDSKGHWVAKNVPADSKLVFSGSGLILSPNDPPLRLRFSHPDYKTFDGIENANRKQNPTLKDLRSKTATVVLGPSVEGKDRRENKSNDAAWPIKNKAPTAITKKLPGHIMLVASLEESRKAGSEFPYGMISVEPNTGDWTKLFDLPRGSGQPTVSRDGLQTFFPYYNGRRFGTMILDNNGEEELRRLGDRWGTISCSSTGNRLIISHRDFISKLEANTEKQAVKKDGTLSILPAPSGHWQIDLADGSEKVLNIPFEYQIEDWSPDGKWLLATGLAGRKAWGDLYLMRSDGSDLRKLTNYGGGCTQPKFSSDGKQVAFCFESTNAAQDIYRSSVHVIDLATQKVQVVVSHDSVRPEGAMFSTLPTYTDQAVARRNNATGGGKRTSNICFQRLAWSPDNKWLALSFDGSLKSHRYPGQALLLISTDGSQQKELQLQKGAWLQNNESRRLYWR